MSFYVIYYKQNCIYEYFVVDDKDKTRICTEKNTLNVRNCTDKIPFEIKNKSSKFSENKSSNAGVNKRRKNTSMETIDAGT